MQEDVRLYIEQSIKQGHSVSNFRKERLGADMFGTTYWYFDDPMLGHRLCRDTRVEPKLKYRVKARDYPAPAKINHHWEMLGTNYEEFHFVAEQLTLSTQKTGSCPTLESDSKMESDSNFRIGFTYGVRLTYGVEA
ncbi:unnamed protein product [Calypogeia fissa]